MKRQGGAAFIVVLSVLVISMMLGLSGMQSSLVDERLAGNYKASAEAQMGAERAASQGLDDVGSETVFEAVNDVDDVIAMEWDDFLSGDDVFESSLGDADNVCSEDVKCFYRHVEEGSRKYVVAFGGVALDNGGMINRRTAVLRVDVSHDDEKRVISWR